MVNLKTDLLNQLRNEKYFEEMEFIRLAAEPNMNYKEKIDSMDYRLGNIASLNARITLADSYLQEQVPESQIPPQQVPANAAPVQPAPHPGQTFSE